MSLRHGLITAVAAVHLLLAALGAAERFPLSATGPPAEGPAREFKKQSAARPASLAQTRAAVLLRLYGELSGTDRSFGFFAPSVAPEYRATFTLEDADGNTWHDALGRGASHEAFLRIGTLIETVAGDDSEDDHAPRWAQVMFRRHPEAVLAEVLVEAYTVPSMAEYRAGARPEWETLYVNRWRRTPDDRKVKADEEDED
jgi:hypothetical protein